jgi:hypothetical protein
LFAFTTKCNKLIFSAGCVISGLVSKVVNSVDFDSQAKEPWMKSQDNPGE